MRSSHETHGITPITYKFQVSYTITDEGFTPTKDGGTCLRRLSMFRKEVH